MELAVNPSKNLKLVELIREYEKIEPDIDESTIVDCFVSYIKDPDSYQTTSHFIDDVLEDRFLCRALNIKYNNPSLIDLFKAYEYLNYLKRGY